MFIVTYLLIIKEKAYEKESIFDLEHFGNNAGLKEFLRRHSLDGLELMEIGEDEKQILQKEDVVGFHRLHYPCWYCFWIS